MGSTQRLEAEQQQQRWNTAENSVFLGKGQRSRRRSDTEDEREANDITRRLLVADSLTLIVVWNSIPTRQLCLTSLHLHIDISTCDIFQQSSSDLSHLNLSSHLRACLFAATQSVFGRANSSNIQLNYHLCLANGLALIPTSHFFTFMKYIFHIFNISISSTAASKKCEIVGRGCFSGLFSW